MKRTFYFVPFLIFFQTTTLVAQDQSTTKELQTQIQASVDVLLTAHRMVHGTFGVEVVQSQKEAFTKLQVEFIDELIEESEEIANETGSDKHRKLKALHAKLLTFETRIKKEVFLPMQSDWFVYLQVCTVFPEDRRKSISNQAFVVNFLKTRFEIKHDEAVQIVNLRNAAAKVFDEIHAEWEKESAEITERWERELEEISNAYDEAKLNMSKAYDIGFFKSTSLMGIKKQNDPERKKLFERIETSKRNIYQQYQSDILDVEKKLRDEILKLVKK